jgi:hypothetical protein
LPHGSDESTILRADQGMPHGIELPLESDMFTGADGGSVHPSI